MNPKQKNTVTSPSKKKQGKDRNEGQQQLSLSSFFKGPTNAKSESSSSKGSKPSIANIKKRNAKVKSAQTSGAERDVITFDDSSDEGEQPARSSLGSLAANGLLSLQETPIVSLTGAAATRSDSDGDVIMIESSGSDPEEQPGPSRRKRRLSSESRSRQSSPIDRTPTSKKLRLSTPPPLRHEPKNNAPGTPRKTLQLTAPLIPSPVKKNRMHDAIGESLSSVKEETDVKPAASFFRAGIATSAGSTLTKTMDPTPVNMDVPLLDFDTDPFLFKPQEIDISHWPGGRLPYEVLVGVYLQVGGTRSRLAIVRILSNFLRLLIHHSPTDLLPTIYLLSNHLKPSYIPLELGIGSQVLNKATMEVSGAGRDVLKRLWNKYGDPGDVAFEAKSNLRTLIAPTPLTVKMLYSQLLKIASIKGNGAAKAKGEIVKRLLVQTKGEEVRYLVRTLVRHIRIGAVRLTLLSSLARAFVLTQPSNSRDFSEVLHATRNELDNVKPIPAKGGGRGKTKVKDEPDTMRLLLERKCVHAIAILRRVYVRHPNYDDILEALLSKGLDSIEERVSLSVGIPLSPMLGSITRSLNEVYTRLGSIPFTAEAKLDGQRVQIHVRATGPTGADDGGGKWVEGSAGGQKVWVRLFSRHLEDMTEKYPDILGLMHAIVNRDLPPRAEAFPDDPRLTKPNQNMLDLLSSGQITSFIIDAEVVALDKDTGAFRTFQDLSNRAKKDVKVEDIKVIVGVFSFDLMLLNDEPLLNQPFSIRRHLLRTLFKPFFNKDDMTIARFGHVESIDSTKPEDVQAFFEQVVSQKCEGLMVKLLESGEGLAGEDAEDDDEEAVDADPQEKVKGKAAGRKKPLPSTYEPDARSQGWLKVKKDYLEGVGDSLDLIPIGAWYGMGRKAGWWSPILLAVYNPETGALEAVCKCLAGFTDVFYKALLEKYPPTGKPEMSRKGEPYVYCETGGLRPDIWFNPQEVWQMAAADITSSPVYTAGASYLGSERGVSLRFPRFISIREDKGIEEATSAEQLADMYRQQMEAAPIANRDLLSEGNEIPEEQDDQN